MFQNKKGTHALHPPPQQEKHKAYTQKKFIPSLGF